MKSQTPMLIGQLSIEKADLSGGVSNTPPQNIDILMYSKVKKYPYCLQNDWLTITFDFLKFHEFTIMVDNESKILLDELIEIISPGKFLEDFTLEKSNKMGYQKRIILHEGIEISLFGPICANGNYSLMLNISGDGMSRISDSQLYRIFKFSANPFHLGKITRFDPGVDNYTSLCKIEDIHKKCDNYEYTCPCKCDIYYSATKDVKGITVYFGLGSNFTLRIYDKNAERTRKDPNFIKEHRRWTRYEFQSRDPIRNNTFATMFMLAYENNDMNIYARFVSDCLMGFLKFHEDITKKAIWSEWDKLLENYKGIKLITNSKATCSLDTKIDWFNRSCMSTVAMIFAIYGETIFERWLLRGIGLQMQNFDSSKLTTIRAKCEELGIYYDTDLESEFKKKGEYLTKKYEDLEGVLKAFVPKE